LLENRVLTSLVDVSIGVRSPLSRLAKYRLPIHANSAERYATQPLPIDTSVGPGHALKIKDVPFCIEFA